MLRIRILNEYSKRKLNPFKNLRYHFLIVLIALASIHVACLGLRKKIF